MKKGHKFTQEQKDRLSLAHIGQKPWNTGTGGCKKGHSPDLYVCMPSGVFVCLGCKRINGKKYREKNRKKINFKNRVSRYGMEPDIFFDMWNKQQGQCAICGQSLDMQALRIDHDHTTGIVRGLLCVSCNTGIGLMQDSPEILMRAAGYISANNGK